MAMTTLQKNLVFFGGALLMVGTLAFLAGARKSRYVPQDENHPRPLDRRAVPRLPRAGQDGAAAGQAPAQGTVHALSPRPGSAKKAQLRRRALFLAPASRPPGRPVAGSRRPAPGPNLEGRLPERTSSGAVGRQPVSPFLDDLDGLDGGLADHHEREGVARGDVLGVLEVDELLHAGQHLREPRSGYGEKNIPSYSAVAVRMRTRYLRDCVPDDSTTIFGFMPLSSRVAIVHALPERDPTAISAVFQGGGLSRGRPGGPPRVLTGGRRRPYNSPGRLVTALIQEG